MNKDLQALTEEIDALITETIFNYRRVLIEGYHEVGKLVLEAQADYEAIASGVRQRPKTIYYAVEFAKKYPNLGALPDGKNASWHKIIKDLPPYEKTQT